MRKIGINFIITVGSIIIALVISEGIVRLFYPQQLVFIRPDVYCVDSSIGWRHSPNVVTTINTGEGEKSYHSDDKGFRISPLHNNKKSDVRILFIGDSFTEGLQVNDNETTPEIIASLIETKYGKKVYACNAGVGDWDPNQYLIQAKQELQRNSYDIGLIFIYLGNDIVSEVKTYFPARKSAYHHFRIPASITKKEMINSILYPISDFLKSHSQCFMLFKNTYSTFLMRAGLTGFSIPPVFFKNNVNSQAFEVTANICKNISSEFLRYNIPVIFVLIPSVYQVDIITCKRTLNGLNIPYESINLEQPNANLKKLMNRLGLEIIDPLKEMRSIDATGNKLYGTVDYHLNRSGYRIMAELIAPSIEKKLNSKLKEKKEDNMSDIPENRTGNQLKLK